MRLSNLNGKRQKSAVVLRCLPMDAAESRNGRTFWSRGRFDAEALGTSQTSSGLHGLEPVTACRAP